MMSWRLLSSRGLGAQRTANPGNDVDDAATRRGGVGVADADAVAVAVAVAMLRFACV